MQKIKVPIFTSLTDPALSDLLRNGGVGVLLTDTVYGLVGSARIPETARRVISVKGREGKPGTLIAADIDQLLELGLVPEHVKAAQQFWPGPVTAVLRTKPGLEHLHLGLGSLAVRVPKSPEISNLLKTTGPLLTTSANRPTEPNIKNIQEAQEVFGNNVDFYVDGGTLESPVASTIVRIKIELLRQGQASINPEALEPTE